MTGFGQLTVFYVVYCKNKPLLKNLLMFSRKSHTTLKSHEYIEKPWEKLKFLNLNEQASK